MLRRSLAMAGPSAAASIRGAQLAHVGCLLCRTAPISLAAEASSSRTFTSTPLHLRGQQKSGYNEKSNRRWGNDDASGSSKFGGKRDRFAKGRFQPRKGGQHKDIDFSIPEPPTAQEVGRKLVEKLSTMVKDPELPEQLVAYGIKGRPAALLLRHYAGGESRKNDSFFHDSVSAIQLFRTWSQDAKEAILELAVAHDAGTPAKAVIFAHLSDAVSSFGIEGEECLGRYCTSAFLDWVDHGLEALISQNPSLTEVKTNYTDVNDLSLARSQLHLLRSNMDLRLPYHRHTNARSLTRSIHLHVGPTNSGKTHGALVALSKARTGIFAGPLRLLAHEVWDRFNSGTISPGVAPRACNLVTGEEKRTVDQLAGLVSCTVEMVSTQRSVEVAVVDEIQMIADKQRGYAWTEAVLGLAAKELHLCGEASVIPLIENVAKACGDHLTIHRYDRLTPLTVADESLQDDLGQIQKGDCIVAFSRSAIFTLKRDIEKRTGLRCAVAYGALPPETKSEQAKLFNEGKLDVMVASDAIGMGLNLRIKRVIFDTLTKWNGKEEVTLPASQIKQIAGRAGRYGTQDKDTKKGNLGGIVTTRHENELEILRAALDSPLLPITRGSIQPDSDTLSQLSALLPSAKGGQGLRTLSQIYADVALLSQIDANNFFLSDFSQQLAISPLIESASRGMLTVSERETFSNAPANTRDERVVAFLSKAVSQYSRGALVDFDDAADGLAMLEVEDEMVSLMQQAQYTKDRLASKSMPSKSAGEGGKQDELPLVAYLNTVQKGDGGGLTGGSAAHPLINITTLLMLESLHRCFTLYLWLSFRFPLAFCYRAEVDKRKKRAEDAIDFVLQGIRFGRAKRLQALGRKPEKKHSRRTTTDG